MSSKLAHSTEENERTSDICFKESTPFSKMLLKDAVKKGLDNCGFLYPTIIQANAIPIGKAGIDLLCQSKSGTGKTLIFCTILLEQYQDMIRELQSLILVPTREIALQIEGILNQIGEHLQGFRAVAVIGGLELTNDRKKLANAKSVVGTPGRVLHLIQNDMLNTSKISLFVLDEADKLMSKTFLADFQKINKSLPKKKQIIACSATFCDDLDKKISSYMKNPLLVSTNKGATLLIGIKQFIYDIPEEKTSILEMSSKLKALKKIFSKISFKQCLAFASSQSRAESYKNAMEKDGWPCEVITGAQDQKTRIEIFKKFKEFKTRILFSTDLMARGIDSEHVNLVLNIEPPDDDPTYLHRIGRAGRFGSHGIAITFISSQKESQKFKIITETIGSGLNIFRYPYNESIDIWNFSQLENDNILETYTFYEDNINKMFDSDKENVNDLNTSSSAYIDSKTYKIEYMDDPNANKIMMTETMSSLQRLPSSNTIDDASSIAPDSDVLRSNSIGSKDLTLCKRPNNNSMSLLEVLIDNSKSSSTEQIDLFEDYKSFDANLNESPAKSKTEETEKLNLKDLLVDTKKSAKPTKDVFSEYEKLKEQGDDMTDSNSYSVTLSQQYEPSAGTSRVAMEQLKLKIPEIERDFSQSFQNKLQKQHFPSPNNNVDELVKVKLNPIVLSPRQSDSSNDSVASNAPSFSVSSEDEGISSGRVTSAKSSGISTSTNEDDDEEEDDNDDDSSDYNYSEESENSNLSDSDSTSEETYQTSDSNNENDHECNNNDTSSITQTDELDDELDDITDTDSDNDDDNDNARNKEEKFVRKQNNIFNSQNFHDLKSDLGATNEDSDNNIYTNPNSSDQNFIYQNAYARWTDLYWNQMTQIQDYVKFCSYVNNNSNI